MPFGLKKKRNGSSKSTGDVRQAARQSGGAEGNGGYGTGSYGQQQPQQPQTQQQQQHQQHQGHARGHGHGHGHSHSHSHPSKTEMNLCGLPISIYGLRELTPSSSRSSAPPPPEVCVCIHMHGRGGSAENEEHICRGVWHAANEERVRAANGNGNGNGNGGSTSTHLHPRELLVVGFDARNHGHRLTNDLAQKGWGVGNEQHAMDLYSMILGTAADVSHLVDLLPSYLFPYDDRHVTKWAVTGKSLGGHAVWHVLKDDARVTVGVPMIGMPDYERLLEFRTKQSFKTNGPPTVPHSLKALLRAKDPAHAKYDRWGEENPFWGKRILTLSGAQDKLVHPSFSQHFLARLLVSEPTGPGGEQEGLRVRFIDGVKHEVTDEMVTEAGQWVGLWGLTR